MSGKFGEFLKKIGSFFSEIFFPDKIKCIFCNRDIVDFDKQPYCEDCLKEVVLNDKNRCIICDEPIENEATVCDMCQKNERFFKRAFCPFVYDGKVRKAILAYKDSNKRYLSKPFAKLIADRLGESGVAIDYVTYVPLSKKKQSRRGFDQAKLLAEEIAKELGVECKCLFEKIKDVKMQKLSSFKERQENTIGMFKLAGQKLSRKDNVLVVDDIITTCATINACCKLIHKRVSNVYVASIARNKMKNK